MLKSNSKLVVNFLKYVHLSVTMKPVMIISTYPNKKSILKIANELVRKKFVACVNISRINSVYLWKEKIENQSEYIAIFKTNLKNKNKVKKKIEETHPYEVPEIIEIDVVSVNKSYLNWIIESTT